MLADIYNYDNETKTVTITVNSSTQDKLADIKINLLKCTELKLIIINVFTKRFLGMVSSICTSLKLNLPVHLMIEDIKFDYTDLNQLSDILMNQSFHIQKLQLHSNEIDINSVTYFTLFEALESSKNLNTIDMSYNKIEESWMSPILLGIKRLNSVNVLNLIGISINLDTCKALLNALKDKPLDSLSIDFCTISNETIVSLFMGLTNHARVSALSLRGITLEKNGLLALALLIRSNPVITRLSITGNNLVGQDLKPLYNALLYNNTLFSIYIYACTTTINSFGFLARQSGLSPQSLDIGSTTESEVRSMSLMHQYLEKLLVSRSCKDSEFESEFEARYSATSGNASTDARFNVKTNILEIARLPSIISSCISKLALIGEHHSQANAVITLNTPAYLSKIQEKKEKDNQPNSNLGLHTRISQ